MKQFRCIYFTCELPDDLVVSWENFEPSKLDFTREKGAKASLSFSSGQYSTKALIENSIIETAVRHGAYLAPMDEDFPDELALLLDAPRRRVSQHYILRYGDNYAIQLVIKDDFQEEDIMYFREIIKAIKPIDASLKGISEYKAIPLLGIEENRFSSMGEIHYLDSEQLIDN